MSIVSVLSIAGSDSGGGAGIQADLKTFAAHGVHGLSAITALTAQNTRGVSAVHVPPRAFLEAQLDALFDDFTIGAVKLGMLANAEVIHTVADALERHRPAHVVLDPVMVATSGARLLEPSALSALEARLFPLATLITPNLPEAELLLGTPITTDADAERALRALLGRAPAVLLKGGHMPGSAQLVDRLGHAGATAYFRHERLPRSGHGTGCTLSSAIAAQLCRGVALEEACAAGIDYVQAALRSAYAPGRAALDVLDHLAALRS